MPAKASDLPITRLQVLNASTAEITIRSKNYLLDLDRYTLSLKNTASPNEMEATSPDGKWIAYLENYNLFIRSATTGGSTGSNPSNFYSLGDTLVFRASTNAAGIELWKTDGTNAGTVLVKDIYPGAIGSNPADFATFGDPAYFQAHGGSAINTEIFKTNGTTEGTALAAELVPGSSGSFPEHLVFLGDRLIFVASTAATGSEIFVLPLSSSPALVNWTGNVSTVWEDPANWEPMQLPGSSSEVVIPSGRLRYPVITAKTQVRKMSCESGASVTVAEGILFKVLQ